MIYGALHSFLARTKTKNTFSKLVERFAGPNAGRTYRLLYNALGVVTLLPVLYVVAAKPGRLLYHLTGFWQTLALGIQLLAVLGVILTLQRTDLFNFIGLGQLTQKPRDAPDGLVTWGPYRWVRHPVYSLGLIFLWLTPVLTTSVLAFNLGWTLYIYIGSIFEEQRLVEQFGSAYVEYARKVPRLIPRVRSKL